MCRFLYCHLPCGEVVRPVAVCLLIVVNCAHVLAEGEVPKRLRPWLTAQTWIRDTAGPVLSLGPPGAFDDRHLFAPCVAFQRGLYRLWYTEVSADPWVIRHARSTDGRKWEVTRGPVMGLDQPWEQVRLFYPTVLKLDGVYVMWYGSYWAGQPNKTAIGCAASMDCLTWFKNPHSPVFRPDPARPWESHYTTSQSVIRLADDGLRIWCATRKAPPFENKYFAVGTASWIGPLAAGGDPAEPAKDAEAFTAWQRQTRLRLAQMLGIPTQRTALKPESRGRFEQDGVTVEKWIITSEPGSRIPAVLYRPKNPRGRMPGVVLTFGHGGSKSHPSYNYLGQLYAKMGVACLAMDPVGEEERHVEGRTGTRAHDPAAVHQRAWNAGRPIMGKLVFDTMRGVDFLLARGDVDSQRVGVAGNSLGGAKAGWMAVLDTRLRFAIVSGWAFDDATVRFGKFCTRVPNEQMRKMLSWSEYLSLAAPHCALLVINGDADVIIDRDADGAAWRGTQDAVRAAAKVYAAMGREGEIQCWFEPGGGHRPYPANKAGLEWIVRHARPSGWTIAKVRAMEETNFGRWADVNGVEFERLYGTKLHLRGATVADFGIRYIPRQKLSVLKPDEIGQPEFTLQGWLENITEADAH